jgi:hypothetical protein
VSSATLASSILPLRSWLVVSRLEFLLLESTTENVALDTLMLTVLGWTNASQAPGFSKDTKEWEMEDQRFDILTRTGHVVCDA